MIVKKLHILILSFLIISPSLSFGESAPMRLKNHAEDAFNSSARIAREVEERVTRDALDAERRAMANQAAEQRRINDLRIQENFNKAAELKKTREITQANKIAQENKDRITKEAVEKRRQISSIKEQERRNLAKQNEVRLQQKIQQEAELKRQAAAKILQVSNARAPVSIQKSPGGLLTQRDQITRGVDKLSPQQRDKTLAVAKEIENKAAALKAKNDLSTTKKLPASHTTNRNALSKQLASEQQMGEAGTIMAERGGPVPFRDAGRVAKGHGGNSSDWVKKTSSLHTSPDGTKFETHWVENLKTGQRVEFKTKFPR